MPTPVFSMGPFGPTWMVIVAVGAVLVAASVGILTGLPAKVPAKHRPEPGMPARLFAIPAGPLVGAGLALLVVTLNDIHPADVGPTFWTCGITGLIAGFITWFALGTFTFFAIAPHAGPMKPMEDGLDDGWE
jgi:hypothetical protein